MEPLVPADTNLGSLDGFMLDTVRLLGSELVALSTGDEFKAAVLLWCWAWKQTPPGSLPNNDQILSSFARLTLTRWRKVKAIALRGFVLCSDGRLYHTVLSKDVIRAAKARKQRVDAINKRYGRSTDGGTEPPTGPPTKPTPETGRDGTGSFTATPATQSLPDKPSPLGARAVKKINGFGSESSGKWGDPANRDAYAVNACIPHLPGGDDAERWLIAMAAEDPTADGHATAVHHMLEASKRAGVGWVSPERRKARAA